MAKKVKETEGSEETSTAVATIPTVPKGFTIGKPLAPAVQTDETVDAAQFEGFKQISLPPIIKPREMPVGAFLHGTITGIMDSPKKEFKSRILQLTRPTDGMRFCFPLTAVVAKALGNNDKEQDAKIGCEIVIRKTGAVRNPKGGKKDMNLFNIYLKEPAVKTSVRA